MIAIIPTINRSPLLGQLVDVLLGDGVRVVIVDGTDDEVSDREGVVRLKRKWNIYRTWNFGLDLGQVNGARTVFVLNDDVILEPGAAIEMDQLLAAGPYGIIGFYDQGRSGTMPRKRLVDTTDSAARGNGHEIAGYAFAANPAKCARCDERFQWYCGDDDLFYSTAAAGHRVGTAVGINVKHPKPRTSSEDVDVRFPGWHKSDLELIYAKWGR